MGVRQLRSCSDSRFGRSQSYRGLQNTATGDSPLKPSPCRLPRTANRAPRLAFDSLHRMQVFLSFTGRTVTLTAKSTDSVADFRARVQDSEGVPPESQILICRGKLLENGRMLADYGVAEQTTVLLRLRLLSATMDLVTVDPASSAEDRYASFEAVVASSSVPNAGVSVKPAFAIVFNKSADFAGSVAVDGGAYILNRLIKEDRVCIIELQPHLMTLTPKQLREALEAGRRKGHDGSDDCGVTTTIGLGADAPAVPCTTASDTHAPHMLRVEPALPPQTRCATTRSLR